MTTASLLPLLRTYYERNGIESLNFQCRHAPSCRSAGGHFTEAKASFVGSEYEEGTLPRLLFLSIDSGSGDPDPTRRTLEFTRSSIESDDVDRFPRGRHWFITHEMCWVLLKQFKPDLTITTTPPFFAHVNSAKCCQNNAGRAVASDVLFDNCREFIPEEIRILHPDVIVTQGAKAKRVIEVGFSRVREVGIGSCRANVVRCGGRDALWIHTHHRSGYGAFWRQRNECWPAFASLVGAFVSGTVPNTVPSAVPPGPRLVKASGRQVDNVTRPTGLKVNPPLVNATLPAVPRSIGELIAAARSVSSTETFQAFISRMHALPGPSHQHVGLFTGMRVQQFQNWQLDENPA